MNPLIPLRKLRCAVLPFSAKEKLAAKAVYLFTFYPRPEGRGNNKNHNYSVG